MKTERRHELQHNELADFLTDIGEKAKPYAKGILGVVLAGLVILCAYLYLNKRAEAEEGESWNDAWIAISNRDQDRLREVIAKFPNKPAAHWAQLVLADIELSRGETSLFAQKSTGHDLIHSAFEDYQHVKENAVHPLLREQALFGMARSQESLGQLSKAREAYEEIVKNYPNGPYSKRAQQRLDDLARDSTKSWYDWFEKTEPVAADLGKSNPFGNPFDDMPSAGKTLPAPPPGFVLPDIDKGKTPPEPKPDQGKTAKPDEGKSDKTDASKSEPAKSDSAKPDTGKPDAGKADTGKPDTGKPEAGKSETAKPEPPEAEPAKDKAPKTEPPKADAPAAATKPEPPKADVPTPDAPKAEAPKSDAPKADSSKASNDKSEPAK